MRNEDKSLIILLLIILFFCAGVLGWLQFTGEINIYGFIIKVPFLSNLFSNGENSINMTISEPQIIIINPSKDLSVTEIKTRKSIYYPGENVYVDFVINNTLKVPYNISVNWFTNNKRYDGWKNISTDWYKIDDINNPYYSNLQIYETGDWDVQVIVDYKYGINNFSIDKITSFKVI